MGSPEPDLWLRGLQCTCCKMRSTLVLLSVNLALGSFEADHPENSLYLQSARQVDGADSFPVVRKGCTPPTDDDCTENQEYHPWPCDCHKYYQCVFGVLHEHYCNPISLIFNPLTEVCEKEETAPPGLCQDIPRPTPTSSPTSSPKPSPTASPTLSPTATPTPSPTTTATPSPTTTSSSTTTPKPSPTTTSSSTTTYTPSPTTPTPTTSYTPSPTTSSPTTTNTPSTIVTTTQSTSTSTPRDCWICDGCTCDESTAIDGFFKPHPESCHWYYQCVHIPNDPECEWSSIGPYDCGDWVFNPEQASCTWPELAPDCE